MRETQYLCACCDSFAFNWNRRRSGWRLSFFYKVVAATTLTGNVITLTVYFLITSRDFFKNYRCGETAMRLITINFLALMTVTGAAGVSAVLMSRVLLLFNQFAISEFMGLGKWISRLGCIVKWLPMFIILCFMAWFSLGFVSSMWIWLSPEGWCSRRWGYGGIAAVTNCRIWYRGEGKCIDTREHTHIQLARKDQTQHTHSPATLEAPLSPHTLLALLGQPRPTVSASLSVCLSLYLGLFVSVSLRLSVPLPLRLCLCLSLSVSVSVLPIAVPCHYSTTCCDVSQPLLAAAAAACVCVCVYAPFYSQKTKTA